MIDKATVSGANHFNLLKLLVKCLGVAGMLICSKISAVVTILLTITIKLILKNYRLPLLALPKLSVVVAVGQKIVTLLFNYLLKFV